MASTKADIFNMALGSIGVAGRIEDADNELSEEAIQCRLFYDHCRGIILEAKEWPFAQVRDQLQDLGTPPIGWAYRYKYPTNARRINRIVNTSIRTPGADQKIPFKISKLTDAHGKAIFTDQAEALADYNDDVDDADLFSSIFTQALVTALAAFIAPSLRVNADIMKQAQAQFTGWLSEATNQAQSEQQEDPYPVSEFERGRA